jgi:hypothetical protein
MSLYLIRPSLINVRKNADVAPGDALGRDLRFRLAGVDLDHKAIV